MNLKDRLIQVKEDREVEVPQVPVNLEEPQADNYLFGISNREQAQMLLGRGLGSGKVASVLGVSPSLISQYLEEPEFKKDVEQMILESSLAASIRSERIDNLEDKALDQVETIIKYITKPMEAIAVLKTINGLERRGSVAGAESGIRGSAEVVVIELPRGVVNAKIAIEVNSSNEVVEVEGRAMRTMSAEKLLELEKLESPR